jgi:hypothetical protein
MVPMQDRSAKGAVYVDPGPDLTVYSDSVTVSGPLVLPGRTVTIRGRRFLPAGRAILRRADRRCGAGGGHRGAGAIHDVAEHHQAER